MSKLRKLRYFVIIAKEDNYKYMPETIKKVVLLGPQGSGKSTQTKVIADFLGIRIVTTSQLLHEVVAKQTDLGRKIEAIINQGNLIPDAYVINLVFDELRNYNCFQIGFLLDGFPRNLAQAEALDNSGGVDRVFNLDISDAEAIDRISGRRVCDNSHIFHIKYKPPQQADICDICGEELYQREDDHETAVARRLKIYREETEQLLDYYRKQNKLILFDGEKSIENVSADILNYLQGNAR